MAFPPDDITWYITTTPTSVGTMAVGQLLPVPVDVHPGSPTTISIQYTGTATLTSFGDLFPRIFQLNNNPYAPHAVNYMVPMLIVR